MADWSSLPVDLVWLIANKLPVIHDFSAFTAVCSSYKSAVDKNQRRPEGCSGPPWLLLCCDENDPPTSERPFLILYKGKQTKFVMDLPELHGRRCWGSPYGWITTLGPNDQLHLFNPLNRRRIELPQQEFTIPEKRNWRWESEQEKANWMLHEKWHWCRRNQFSRVILIKKTVPSSYDSFNNFLVVTLDSYELFVIRPHSWAQVTLYPWVQSRRAIGLSRVGVVMYDIAVYNGQIYMLGIFGRLFVCSNFDGPDPPTAHELMECMPGLLSGYDTEKLYLVESLGELLMLVRYIDEDEDINEDDDEYDEKNDITLFGEWYHTEGLEVHKFDHDARKWIEIEDIGNCAIFVGDGQSISLPQPEKFGCRKNCIYFTDDNYERFPDYGRGGHDMGIYDLQKEAVEPFYEGPDSKSTYSAPTWLLPSFTG